MPVTAVVFDIGNVLIEWQPERFYDAQIGPEQRRAMFAALDLHAMNERVDAGEVHRDVVYEVADANPTWRDAILMWHDNWIDMAGPVISHSVGLMAALQAKGVPVYSLTNFGVEPYVVAAETYPFLTQFDRDYISGHMKVTKPSAQIYAMLERDCGVPPSQLLFTDDRADNIAAAHARGWQTHLFDGAAGLAACLVGKGLLTETEAART